MIEVLAATASDIDALVRLEAHLFVEDAGRNGIAVQLTDRFPDRARDLGCVEAHVDHDAANTAVGALYEPCGFRPRSLSRTIAREPLALKPPTYELCARGATPRLV